MLLLYVHERANQESELSFFSSQKIGPANVLIYVACKDLGAARLRFASEKYENSTSK